MLKFFIMCGVAFSGKSTLARAVADATHSDLVAFDELWVEKDREHPISKDAKGWRFVRDVAIGQIREKLLGGTSVVYDETNVRFEHREELRRVAKETGARAVVIYLNTSLQVIQLREQENKTSHQRHEVEPENVQAVQEQLEPPTREEGVLVFTPDTNRKDFLKKLNR